MKNIERIEKDAARYVSSDILRSHDLQYAETDYIAGATVEYRKKWISIDIRKPPKDYNVIVWNDVKGKWKVDHWLESGWYDSQLNEITHWMEIKPPK